MPREFSDNAMRYRGFVVGNGLFTSKLSVTFATMNLLESLKLQTPGRDITDALRT